MSKPKIVVIGGPTASGKSQLAIEVAKKFNGEIINADSRQFYRGLDIGTGKEQITQRLSDNSVEIKKIKHYLIDFLNPDEEFNLFKFQQKTFETIDTIINKGKLPIIVGGTGLYIDSVIYNYSIVENNTDLSRRRELTGLNIEQLQKIAGENIVSKLNLSDRNNPHRLIRAIERKESNTPTPSKGKLKYEILYICIDIDKKEMKNRINDRVGLMFKEGLEKENIELRKNGLTTKYNSMKSIGYQEFDDYLSGKQTIEETKELIKIHTRQYAKRQMTWFRKNQDANWIKTRKEAISLVSKFL